MLRLLAHLFLTSIAHDKSRVPVLQSLSLDKSCSGSNVDVNCSLQDAIDQGRDEELITKCLERFLYVRCYDSLEFIATLKVRDVNFSIGLWLDLLQCGHFN